MLKINSTIFFYNNEIKKTTTKLKINVEVVKQNNKIPKMALRSRVHKFTSNSWCHHDKKPFLLISNFQNLSKCSTAYQGQIYTSCLCIMYQVIMNLLTNCLHFTFFTLISSFLFYYSYTCYIRLIKMIIGVLDEIVMRTTNENCCQ